MTPDISAPTIPAHRPGRTRSLRVGFDLDGVMYPLVPALRHFLHTHHGRPLEVMGEPTLYDFGPQWGLTGTEFVQALHDGVRAGVVFTWGEPLHEAAAVTSELRAAGHTVHIVTSRFLGDPGQAEDATRRWLAAAGVEYDSLTLSEDKTVVATDVFVDDLPANVEAVTAAGSFGVLMSAGYNRGVSHLPRVSSLREFAALVEDVAAVDVPVAV